MRQTLEDKINTCFVKVVEAAIWGAVNIKKRPASKDGLTVWKKSRRINLRFAQSPLIEHYADCMKLDFVRIKRAIIKANIN